MNKYISLIFLSVLAGCATKSPYSGSYSVKNPIQATNLTVLAGAFDGRSQEVKKAKRPIKLFKGTKVKKAPSRPISGKKTAKPLPAPIQRSIQHKGCLAV